MTTLTDAPLAPLLDRLFAEADAPSPEFTAALDELGPDQRASLAASARADDYLRFYSLAKSAYLAISPETGRLLYMLIRSTAARSVVEFGTSFGISTLHIAAGLRDNGGGRVITTEFEASKAARAHQNFVEAGLADLVEIREGDALQTLAADLPEQIDLVLMDGAKALYPAVLDLLEPHLRAGAPVVADNADMAPDYLRRVRSGDGYVSAPVDADVELSLRVG